MGFPMAGHLAKAGHQVTVYNRSAAKAQAWVAEFGGKVCERPKQRPRMPTSSSVAWQRQDLASVVLGDNGAFAGMKKGALFVDHTTASAKIARELAAQAQKHGLTFLDAPVSGGQAGAVNGLLTVMVGGDQARFDQAKPVAMAFSRAFTRIGESGAGQLAKMVNQICIAGLGARPV